MSYFTLQIDLRYKSITGEAFVINVLKAGTFIADVSNYELFPLNFNHIFTRIYYPITKRIEDVTVSHFVQLAVIVICLSLLHTWHFVKT